MSRLRHLFCLVAAFAALSLSAGSAVVRVSIGEIDHVVVGAVCRQPSMSADGKRIVFSSPTRLSGDDMNSISDVFLRDLTTNTTRRLSDNRGGDQPVISANGRVVVFRALDGLTRLRVVDLELPSIPTAAAIPESTSNYNRPSDSAAISPDGRYVAYAYRPSPELVPPTDQTRGHQVMETDLLKHDGPRVVPSTSGSATSIASLGRVVMSYDGELVVFETNDRLTGDDTNDGPDIYVAHHSTGALQRISKPAPGQPDTGASYSPVIAADGSRVYFLSDAPLSAADDDGRTSLYVANYNGSTFGAPAHVPTAAIPVALSPQATIAGSSLVFLGKVNAHLTRAIFRDLFLDTETIIPTGTWIPDAAPVLSGDGSVIAFSAHDATGEQIYTATVPGVTPRSAPTVTLSTTAAPIDGAPAVSESSSFTVSSSVTASNGTLRLLKIEQDGLETTRAKVSALSYQQTGVRGFYHFTARAFNDVWLEGRSDFLNVAVRPSNRVAISGTQDFTRAGDINSVSDRVGFFGKLRIDNSRSSTTGPLRVIITDAPTPAIMAFGVADFPDVPPGVENVLAMYDVPAVAPNHAGLVVISGSTTPAQRLDPYFGRGRTVLAYLYESTGGVFAKSENPAHPAIVLQSLPRLDENTPLPNGGVPLTDGSDSDANFNPQTLNSLVISGRGRVGGPAQAAFAATGVFNTGNRVCIPAWTVPDGGALATISPTGILTVRNLTAARNITVHASFFGKNADFPVVVFPLPPRISVRATIPSAAEGGASGQFRLTRTGSLAADLTLAYQMEGTAENGEDYTALSGTATIPTGSAFTALSVDPQDDAELEGLETVVLRLLPDPSYHIIGAPTARVLLNDNEPIPADQPDLTLRLGARLPVGTNVFQATEDEYGYKQGVTSPGALNRPVNFIARVFNRGSSPQAFSFQGSPADIGFNVRYLFGHTDITTEVIAGTYTLPMLNTGVSTAIVVSITPTATAPIGGSFQCQLRAFAPASTSADLGGVTVTRVR